MIFSANAASPASTNMGAFFDIDGTLLPAPSLEWRFASYLLARDEIRGMNIARWLAHRATALLLTPRVFLEADKCYLANLRESFAADWESSLAIDSHAADSLLFFTAGIERISWHLAQGHRVFFISGTLAPLARVIAKHFRGAVGVCATELEVRDERWTGKLAGEHLSGVAKVRAIRSLAWKHDFSLACSYAYGNDVTDGPMLNVVGHAVAVNPSKHLACLAEDRGWQVRKWAGLQATRDKNSARLIPAKETR